MRTLAVAVLALVLAVPLQAQDAGNILGAAGAVALAKQHLGVSDAAVQRLDPGTLNSRSTGYREVEVTYYTNRAEDCRLAAAFVVMGISMSAQPDGHYGEWSADVECGEYSADVRIDIGEVAISWWVTQYDRSGREVYAASKP